MDVIDRHNVRILVLVILLILSSSARGGDKGVMVAPRSGDAVTDVWGVFVGVSEYEHEALDLQYAHRDAKALHRFFRTQFSGQVPEDHFKLLTNDDATRKGILKTLNDVLLRAFEDDLVILSVSMHAIPDERGTDLWFVAHDTDPNEIWDRGISHTSLLQLLSRCRARRIVLLLDSCNSGGFATSESLVAMKNVDAAETHRLLRAMGEGRGIAVVTSSSAAERSREGKQYCDGHGAFTCALLDGLRGEADANANRLIEIRELFDFVYRRVKDDTEGLQNPDISGSFDNDLPLAFTTIAASLTIETKPRKGVFLEMRSPEGDVSEAAAPHRIKEAQPGAWVVVARKEGYLDRQMSVDVKPGAPSRVSLSLEPIPVVETRRPQTLSSTHSKVLYSLLLGGGAAFIGAGIYHGTQAAYWNRKIRKDQIKSWMHIAGSYDFHESELEIDFDREVRPREEMAWGFGWTGAAFVAGGMAWMLVDLLVDQPSPEFTVAPISGGAMLLLGIDQ